MSRELLFRVSAKDCIRQTFRGSGAGGQNRNKRDTGVRFIHPPSGARGEACDERQQGQNAKLAFRRMAESKEFRMWHRMEVARLTGRFPQTIDEIVDEQMKPENLVIEYL